MLRCLKYLDYGIVAMGTIKYLHKMFLKVKPQYKIEKQQTSREKEACFGPYKMGALRQ